MDKSLKKVLICIAFGVGLFALLMNIVEVWDFFKLLYSLVLPVALGFIIAFVLNVPMKGFKKLFALIFKKAKRRPPEKVVDIICVTLVFALVALIIWITVMLAIPSLISTFEDIANILEEQIPTISEWMTEHDIDPKILTEFIDFLHVDDDSGIQLDFGAILSPVFSTVTSVLSTTVSVIFALVVCIYALLSKAEIKHQGRRMTYSIFPKKLADKLCYVYTLARDTYSKFLTAQCIEACILGVMMFLSFTIFEIPFAGLVAVLTAIFAFIPYIGAFGACFVGAFLTLVAEPEKVLLCIIVYTVTQFIENQFIYPHVVGNSIGLSPIWTLVAALVGGNLMGLFGMIFFIPLASVLSVLLGEFTTWRLGKKKIVIERAYESFPEDAPPPDSSAADSSPEQAADTVASKAAENTEQGTEDSVQEEPEVKNSKNKNKNKNKKRNEKRIEKRRRGKCH